MLYFATFKRDGNDTILVQFPDVPEAITFGIDAADARGRVPIPLPAAVVAKLELYSAMRNQRITKTELARRLDCHRQHVDRILDLAHRTRFEVLEKALELVGKRASLVVEDAA